MRRYVVIITILSFARIGFSQNVINKFSHLSTSDGLSQNTVTSFIQDNLGQIWIGTRDGLNKYDGNKFTVYRQDKNNLLSISNNDVLCLEYDSSGFIWVGTYQGLNRYDPKKDTFNRYAASISNSSVVNNIIWTVKELSNKEIWVGTPLGLSIYNKTTDSFTSRADVNQVYTVFETKKGTVFIGTKNGLKQFVGKTKDVYQFKNIKETEGFSIQDIIESPNGNLLLGTRTQSVLEYNITKERLEPYFDETILKDKNKNVRQLLFDDDGKLLLGTFNGLQIADKRKNITTINYNINDNKSISDNSIRALFKDKKGSIWIGTYYGGINVWDETNTNFINITQKPGNTGLGFKVVSSIVKYKDFLFFGTEGGGISILNVKTKVFNYINTKNTPALKSDNIKSLFLAKDNNLWIGTFENGIAIYNLETKNFGNVNFPDKLRSYLADATVLCIQQSTIGDMLIGTSKGFINYNIKKKSYNIIHNGTKPHNLSSGIIRSIKVDSKNNIWVSTLTGLNVIHPNGTIKKYFFDSESKLGISMTAIFEDSNGVIWAGTEVEGLFKFVNNKFIPVNLSIDNTSVTGIRSIVEEEKGYLWISSSNQGIICFDPLKNKVIASYTEREGLASNQFNNNASLQVDNSHLIFGGPSGAVFFDTKNLIKNTYVPQVIITDFKIKNQSISVNDQSQLLTNTISYTKDIKLTYQQGNFSISFAIPNYINSSSNHYKYRLKGLENEWIETTENTASYTIQNPGNYTFEVIGINNDRFSNNIPTTLKIRVNPAPWRTWWAFMLYGVLIFTVLYYLSNILKSKTKLKLQLDLEKIEAEQTKEINKAKLEFFTNISHEFRTPLTLILGPLHQILENYKGSSGMYKKLKVVESSANHLLQLINRLMDFRKLENNLIKLEAAEGNIVKYLKEIFLSFSVYAKDGNYTYNFETPSEEILVFYDRYKLERVFYNLLSNAFRYTPKGGKICLRLKQEKNKLLIQVEDSGVGIAKEYQDKIFERFFELSINNKPDNDYNKGTGIGLSIVKNIIDLHRGKICVKDNDEGKGSVFIVELPLGREHLEDSDLIQDFKFSDDLTQYVDQFHESESIVDEDLYDKINSQEKQTILLVEDNKPLRKFMRDLLKNSYNVFEAENGKIACEIAIQEQIDLIVSDVVMPVMTGTELCEKIKEDIRTSHIPLILLTSRSSLIYKLEGLESGADDYISKPFNVQEFKLRIKNILSSINRLKLKLNTIDLISADDIVLPSLDEKLYKKALKIVEDNISNEQFDISSFCEELGVSRTVLFKKIKAWTDFTPNEFVQHIRLRKGAQFIEQGNLNISQISYNLGFKSPKYFSKCFRKKYGKTPTEYQKKFFEY